jgi:hypothetical protein
MLQHVVGGADVVSALADVDPDAIVHMGRRWRSQQHQPMTAEESPAATADAVPAAAAPVPPWWRRVIRAVLRPAR